jgi:DUF971 family protein
MHIEWSDGHRAVYPHEVLRGYCPCADCQGHSGTIKFRPGGDLEVREITTVGNYAINVVWGDRHGSGIYNYEYLRMLCHCAECKPDGFMTGEPPGTFG